MPVLQASSTVTHIIGSILFQYHLSLRKILALPA